MRFWDSSALAPLLLDEAETKAMRELLAQDPLALVWVATGVELASALWRRSRSGHLTDDARTKSLDLLQDLEDLWNTVIDVMPVMARARRVLATHPLRSADACQLAAALHASRERPHTLEFVTLDTRLADAARKEGFRVLPAS